MTIYIALFRGINVSGHNNIKMADLKQLFLDLGYFEVITFIQSGNVIFNSDMSETSKIEQTIVEAVKNKYEYQIKVLVLDKNNIETIFKSNPFFDKIHNIDISKLHVTLLDKAPSLDGIPLIKKLIKTTNDKFQIIDKTVYLYCPNGYGKTKLNNNLFEKKLKVNATTRNWRSFTKLFELIQQ
jgi:uncharacterized protein (DUF1697 family)